MIPSARRMLLRVGALLLVIAPLSGRTESSAQEVDQPGEIPVEEFKPARISANGRLNLWLATEDCVVQLHLDLPKEITESTKVSLTGGLTSGPNVQKYKMPQGAATPPWPQEQDHLYRQEKLGSGVAVCKPTGKVDDRPGFFKAIELEIVLEKLNFAERSLKIDRPIVVFWNMPPPP